MPKPLEAIILNAMSLEPSGRYAKALDLANDVECWLNGEPVSVWPEPWTVVVQRWMKKHPRKTTALISSLIALLVLLIVNANFKRQLLNKDFKHSEAKLAVETNARQNAERLQRLANAESIRAKQSEENAIQTLVTLGLQSKYWSDAAPWLVDAVRREKNLATDHAESQLQPLRLMSIFSQTPTLKHVIKDVGHIQACELDEKGERLMTFTYDGGVSRVRIWDVRNGKLLNGAIPEMTESRRIATMSRSGRYLAIDAELGLTLDQRSASVELWDLDTFSRIGEPRPTNGPVSFLGINEADRRVVCVTRDSFAAMKKDKIGRPNPQNPPLDEGGQITAYDLDSFAPIGKPFDLRGATSSIRADHQTRRLAVHTLADQNRLHLWDVSQHESIPLPRGIGDTHSAALDSTGEFLAIGTLGGGVVHFWDLSTNIESRTPVPVVGPRPGVLFVDRTDVVGRSARALVFDDDRITSRASTFARLVQTSLDFNHEIELDGGVASVSKRSSADGLVVAIGTTNGRVHLVNKLIGNEVCLPVKHSNEIMMAEFLGAGDELVTVSSDGFIRIWTMEGLKESRLAKYRPREWGGKPAPDQPGRAEARNMAHNPRDDEKERRNAIELSEDFRFIAEVDDSMEPELRLSDAKTNEPFWSSPLPDGFTADRMAILKVGEWIVVSSQKAPHWLPSDQRISLLNAFRDRWRQETTEEKTRVIAYSSKTGQPIGKTFNLPGPVVACEFLTDQRVLLVGNDRSGGGGFVQIHHLADDNAAPLSHEMRGMISAQWNPIAQELGVLLQSGKVERLMFHDGNWRSMSEAGNLIRQIDRFPGGGIAMGDFNGKIGIVKPDGSYAEQMFDGVFVAGVSASPDGKFLATIIDDNQKGRISLVRVDGMHVVRTVRRNQELFLVKHSPDGRMLAVTDRFGDVEILDAKNLRPVVRTLARETVVNRHLFPSELRFSADSQKLMLKHRGGVAVWDLKPPETNWEQQVLLAFGTRVDPESGELRDWPLDAPAEYENFLREMYPDDEWLTWIHFRESMKNSNFEDASKFLPTIQQLAERTEDSGVTSALADYFWKRREFKKAVQLRSRLMAIRSDDTKELINYAQEVLLIAPEESLTLLEKCEKIYRQQSDPLLPFVVLWQGHAHAQLGEWKKAEENFDSVRTSPWFQELISPNASINCNMLHYMGKVSLANGNHDQYREFCRLAVTSAMQSKDIEAITATLSLTTLRPNGLDDYSTVLPLAAQAAESKKDDANYRLAYGAALFRAGKSKEAITELNESKRLMEAGGAVNSRYAKALPSYFLALTYAQMEDGDKARGMLATAREEVHMFREKSEANGEAINWTTRLTLESLDAEATLPQMEDGLKIRRMAVAADPVNKQKQLELSISLMQLGDVVLSLGYADDALKHFQEGLKIRRDLAANEPNDAQKRRDLSISLESLGNVFLNQGRADDAVSQFKESLETRRALVAANPDDAEIQQEFVNSLEQVSDVFLRLERDLDGLSLLQEGLIIRRALAQADLKDVQRQRNLFSILERLGNVFLKLNRSDDAFSHFQEGLQTRRMLAKADPNDPEKRYSLSKSYNNLIEVFQNRSRYDDAVTKFDSQLKIGLLRAEADPDDSQKQQGMAIAYDNLADVLKKQGRTDDALLQFENGWKIRLKLAEADPKNLERQHELMVSQLKIGLLRAEADPDDSQKQQELAKAHHNLGEVLLSRKRIDDAHLQFEDGLKIRRNLAEAAPKNEGRQHDLVFSHYALGIVEFLAGRFQPAMTHYQDGIVVLDRMIADDQDVANCKIVKEELERDAQGCGNAILATRDWETLLKADAKKLPELLSIRVTELAKRGQLADVAQAGSKLRELAETAENGTGINQKAGLFYNAACAYSLSSMLVSKGKPQLTAAEQIEQMKYLDLSLDCLKEAVAAGYSDFHHMLRDPDLAPLRKFPEFQALVKQRSKK